MKTTKPTISKDELRESIRGAMVCEDQEHLKDPTGESCLECQVDKVLKVLVDQQRQLLDRLEAELPTERVKVPYGLVELQKAFENGHDKAIGQVQVVIKDIREGLS